ncbi:hypothetical protein GEMRC1_004590 [Eukaryota sp. GEM-RC1]
MTKSQLLASILCNTDPLLCKLPFNILVDFHAQHLKSPIDVINTIVPSLFPCIDSLNYDRFVSSRVLSLTLFNQELLYFSKPIEFNTSLQQNPTSPDIIYTSSVPDFLSTLSSQIQSTLHSHTTIISSSLPTITSSQALGSLFANHLSVSCLYAFWSFYSVYQNKKNSKVLSTTISRLKSLLTTASSEEVKRTAQYCLVLYVMLINDPVNNFELIESDSLSVRLNDVSVPITFDCFSNSPLPFEGIGQVFHSKLLESTVNSWWTNDESVVFSDSSPYFINEMTSFCQLFTLSLNTFELKYSELSQLSLDWQISKFLLSCLVSDLSIINLTSELLSELDLNLLFQQLNYLNNLSINLENDFPLPNAQKLNSDYFKNLSDGAPRFKIFVLSDPLPIKFDLFTHISIQPPSSNIDISAQILTSSLSSLGFIDGYSLSLKVINTINQIIGQNHDLINATLLLSFFTCSYFSVNFSICSTEDPSIDKTSSRKMDTRRSSITTMNTVDSSLANLSVSLLMGLMVVTLSSSDQASDDVMQLINGLFPSDVLGKMKSLYESSMELKVRLFEKFKKSKMLVELKLFCFNLFEYIQYKQMINLTDSFMVNVINSQIDISLVVQAIYLLGNCFGKKILIFATIDDFLKFSASTDNHWIIFPFDTQKHDCSRFLNLSKSCVFFQICTNMTQILNYPTFIINFPLQTPSSLPLPLIDVPYLILSKYSNIDFEDPITTINDLLTKILEIFKSHTFANTLMLNVSLKNFKSICLSLLPPVINPQSLTLTHVTRALLLSFFTIYTNSSTDPSLPNSLSSTLHQHFPSDVPQITKVEEVYRPLETAESVASSQASDSANTQSDYSYDSEEEEEIELIEKHIPSLESFALDPLTGEWVSLDLMFSPRSLLSITHSEPFCLYSCHLMAPCTTFTAIHSSSRCAGKKSIVKLLTRSERFDGGQNSSYQALTSRLVTETARKRKKDQKDQSEDALHPNSLLVHVEKESMFSVDTLVQSLIRQLSSHELNHFGTDLTVDFPLFSSVLLIEIDDDTSQAVSDALLSLLDKNCIGDKIFKFSKIYLVATSSTFSTFSSYFLDRCSFVFKPAIGFEALQSIIFDQVSSSQVASLELRQSFSLGLSKLIFTCQEKWQEMPNTCVNVTTAIKIVKYVNAELYNHKITVFPKLLDQIIEIILGSQISFDEDFFAELATDVYSCFQHFNEDFSEKHDSARWFSTGVLGKYDVNKTIKKLIDEEKHFCSFLLRVLVDNYETSSGYNDLILDVSKNCITF